MSDNNEALLTQAAQYVAGKNHTRKDTVDLVRRLVEALEKAQSKPASPPWAREVPMPDPPVDPCELTVKAPGKVVAHLSRTDDTPYWRPAPEVTVKVDLQPCRVNVHRLHDSALMLGPDSNKAYNRVEALSLADKIRTVAESLK